MAENKTTIGLPVDTVSMLCYVLGPITGFLFLILEKNPTIKFHAMQSIVVFGGLMVLQMIFASVIILIPLASLLGLLGFALWLLLLFKTYNGEKFEVPFAIKIVKQLLG